MRDAGLPAPPAATASADLDGGAASAPAVSPPPPGAAQAAAADGAARPTRPCLFAPERGHRYSGRNNDGALGLAEAWYFARTIAPVLLGGRGFWGSGGGSGDGGAHDQAVAAAEAAEAT